jgi:HTH-type transcriptional regulator/antitoxin HigA
MAPQAQAGRKRDVYLELVRQVPLRPIRSDKELQRAIAMVDGLIDRDDLGRDEQDYLDVLSDLVERYESEEYPIAPVSDAEMLRHLMEAKGVTQTEVAQATDIAASTVSEVLAGKRTLSRTHIGKLARYFHVGPGVFRFEP